jgi:hypothetical protein
VGAVLVDDRDRILVCEKRVMQDGRWTVETCLPKGPLQPRETDADAALAEVRRLTGFEDVVVLADLGKARVEYHHRGVLYARSEHFFLLRLRSHQVSRSLQAQDEETRMTSVRFVDDFDKAAEVLDFPSEQSAVLRARAWLPH